VRLFRAEWTRLFARRFTKIMLVVVITVLAVVGLSVAANSHRIDDAARTKARAEAAAELQRYQKAEADCRAAKERGEDISRRYPPDCDFGPFQPQEDWFLPYEFRFRAEMPNFLLVAAGVLTLFGFLVGASFVGAEWTSGGMTNLLLWRPRRLVVLGSKLFTLLVGVLLTSALVIAAYVGSFWLIARYRGALGNLTRGFWESLALTGGRAVGLVLVGAAAGFALASLGRHTATALGVGIGYALIVEVGGQIVLSALAARDPARYVLSSYVSGWLFKRYELPPSNCAGLECKAYVITWGMSAAVLGAVVLATVLVAFVSMRRRDVT
jgi:ABC-2 type transport system permease protein